MLASQQTQKNFIYEMSTVLCPAEDVDAVRAWVNSNLGSVAETEINGFGYELYFGNANNQNFASGRIRWEDWITEMEH